MSVRTYSDFSVGDWYDVGSHAITKSEIIEFATEYDPQPFHIDETAAEDSHFDGLVASGWHTTAILTKLCVQNLFNETASGGGLGVDELRWPTPVRPGDTLSGSVEVADARLSDSRSDRGYIDFEMILSNQQGETVLSMINHQIVLRSSQ